MKNLEWHVDFAVVLQSQPSVLCKELQLQEIIFLDVLMEIVELKCQTLLSFY